MTRRSFTILLRTFPTFWTQLPLHVPLMTAWAGGPKAERLEGLGEDEIVQRALASLEATFGVPAADMHLESALAHDWGADPFARGAYSYVLVGGSGSREALATADRVDTILRRRSDIARCVRDSVGSARER